jgi:photosynthetic reaction center cytochrome c subunit
MTVTGFRIIAVTALVALVGAVATAQGPTPGPTPSPPAERPPMAEEVFKNIQVLKGIPVDQFMTTMGFLSASLGLNCTDCHVDESGGSWSRYADDNDLKRTSRRMMLMVATINRTNFGGRQVVTCNTCHRGFRRPNVMPSLNSLYGTPPPDEPGDPFVQANTSQSAGALLDKHVAAAGGAQRLAALRTITAKGTYLGFDDAEPSPLEMHATNAGERAIVAHLPSGDNRWIFNGRAGWIAGPATDRPIPVMAITGQELDGLGVEVSALWPLTLKQRLSNLRVGLPAVLEDNREVDMVQGDTAGGGVVTLCFDAQSGLLRRLVRYGESPVGRLVTRVDYTEYKEVAGVKVPSKWTVTWLSGRSQFELTDITANGDVDRARFLAPPTSR